MALDNVSFQVKAGEICGLIGPNGAGKTTLFNCVTNLYRLSSGSIHFNGEKIDAVRPHDIISRGIARTFQNLGIYPGMTVLENVLLGAHHAVKERVFGALFRPGRAAREEAVLKDMCLSIIADLGLGALAGCKAGSLPYGTLKRVEIARALASRPQLLMLDEPAAGLTHAEVAEFGELVMKVRSTYGLTVLLVEHHMGLVMGICHRLVVLNVGKLLAEGTPSEVRSNPAVIAAYLGHAA
ncbi:MAG: ABC transporter ATP-binding protein [Telluria sp.]